MLARTQWTKPSLDDFIAWLETKPPGEGYNWVQPRECACAQYAASIGLPWFEWVSHAWNTQGPVGFWERMNLLERERPWTFGALLEKALRHKATDGC
jgi:hypothetical protein